MPVGGRLPRSAWLLRGVVTMLCRSFALPAALLAACSLAHRSDDAPTDDPAPRADAGRADLEPCPDFSCEARCAAVSVCPDAGVVDAIAPASDAGPPPRPAGPEGDGAGCGDTYCEPGTEFCLACERRDAEGGEGVRDAQCIPVEDPDNPFSTAFGEHGCGFPSVMAMCDGPEDCAEHEVCLFSGGEFGYAQCWAAEESWGPVACRSDDDCEAGERCGEIDPFGYFSPLYDVLGWRPYACGGASAAASTFCDRFEAICSLDPATVYDRQSCLQRFDGYDEDGQTCAGHMLTEAEAGAAGRCEAAVGADPCSP